MTSITSPRETSVNGRRIPQISTPTSSSRPSFENPRSTSASPNRGPPSVAIQPAPRRNRAALREYYNLKASAAAADNDAASITSSIHDNSSFSEVIDSDLDNPDFDGESYVKTVLETQSLADLLRTYNGVLTDIRALDAEKKALVYDNYSKLIAATETIRKMRSNMDPLNPMAGTLDLAIRGVWESAEALRTELKDGIDDEVRKELEMDKEERERLERKRRTREIVEKVLDTPERVRALMSEGREDEARHLWEVTRGVLERWREKGVGGSDVQDCIDDGEAAMRGEPAGEKSWEVLKEQNTKS